MKEIRDLRLQLARLVGDHMESFGLDPGQWAAKPPTATQQSILQQVIVAGLIDQVARKIPPEVLREHPELRGAYRSCTLDEPLWLHPSSAFFKQQPDLICYQEIVVGKRATMRGITRVPADSLHQLGASLCHFSAPLQERPRWYDTKQEQLMCFVLPTYGKHGWQLQPAAVPLPDSDKSRYKLFGKLLLSGA